ncbi:MAG: hypothetical protein IAF02_10880 [Anaerolineae bacterium]|nr:hypothetical protein [Anaerolineae bacterium]
MAQTKPNNSLLILTTIIVAVCMLGCLGLLALNTVSPQMGMTSTVCAGVSTTPKWQIGVSWVSIVSSYLPPMIMSPYAQCIHIPHSWTTTFSPSVSGSWLFPP